MNITQVRAKETSPVVIMLFTLAFFFIFLITKSYSDLPTYYPTVLYVSLVSLIYALICSKYNMWQFTTWWVFTNELSALVQATILFPTTTVLYLRYLPRRPWLTAGYFVLFVAIYVVMEWFMVKNGGIKYGHGWDMRWSAVIDILMFLMIWIHHQSPKWAWSLSVIVTAFFVIRFDVPLLG